MSVETTTTVVWTCDVKGCSARYEGVPPLADGIPVGFAVVQHRLGKDLHWIHPTSGVFCSDHAAHVAAWLEGVKKGTTL